MAEVKVKQKIIGFQDVVIPGKNGKPAVNCTRVYRIIHDQKQGLTGDMCAEDFIYNSSGVDIHLGDIITPTYDIGFDDKARCTGYIYA